ncbi:MAG TPA: GldG family protein [Opitutaceae bacterium]|nr:GldG family protein [Opitutaceae bacterium]
MHWPDSFQANRRLRTVNLALQAFLFLTLFAGINFLALHFPARFDLTRNRFFSLSAESRSYLEQLKDPVHIVVAFDTQPDNADDEQARRDIGSLVREYVYAGRASGRPLITTEELDVFQQTRRAASLGITTKNVVVFVCGDRRRYVSRGELYLIEEGEKRAFIGERAFTAAILDVTAAAKQKLYFLKGHGEMEPGSVAADRGLSQLTDELRARNFDIDILDLARARRIPEDASLLLAIGPRAPYLPEEQDKLRDFLANQSGRLLLALEPGPNHGLDDLLRDWGIRADDVLLVDRDPQEVAEGGDLILRRFGPHSITQVLINNQIPLLAGRLRVVRPDPRRAPDPSLKLTTLIGSSSTAWGERSFRRTDDFKYDLAVDLPVSGNPPTLPVATLSERVTAANLPFSVRGGKLLVFGTSDIFANNRLTSGGNLTLARNAIDWATERDAQLNIPPRPIAKFQLTLSQTELGKLRLGLLLIVPGAVALLGLFVYWSRRS